MTTKAAILGENNKHFFTAYETDTLFELFAELEKHGHRFEATDLDAATENSHGRRMSTAQRIKDIGQFEHIFKPELWVRNLPAIQHFHRFLKTHESLFEIDFKKFEEEVSALETMQDMGLPAIDKAVADAIARAGIDNNVKQRVTHELVDTLVWMLGQDDNDEKPLASQRIAAAKAVQNPAMMVAVAQGLAEGNKPLDYASNTIVAAMMDKPKPAKPLYNTALDARKAQILRRSYDGFLNGLLEASYYNQLPQLREKLHNEGYDFGKADLLSRAHDQYPNFICHHESESKMLMSHADFFLAILHDNGEFLTTQEWQTEFVLKHNRYTMIGYAGKFGHLAKVFKPELWTNHTEEMRALWEVVPQQYRTQINFDALLKEAEKLSSPAFEVTPQTRKHDVVKVDGNGHSALDDVRVWRQFTAMEAALASHGESFSKHELLAARANGKSFIQLAVQAGMFSEILDHLMRHGERMTVEEAVKAGVAQQLKTNKQRLMLVDRDNIDALVKFPNADSLFHMACEEHDLELMKRVVAHLKTAYANDPQKLHAALTQQGLAKKSPLEVVKSSQNKDLEVFIQEEAADALARIGNPEKFMDAIQDNDITLVKKFLAHKKNGIEVGSDVATPLIRAVDKQRDEMVDLLLAAGADPTARTQNKYDATPLIICANHKNFKIAEKISRALKEKYKEDPIGLFKALTTSSSYYGSAYTIAKKSQFQQLRQLLDTEIEALMPHVVEWDEKTLKDTNARSVLNEYGKMPQFIKASMHRPHKRIAIVGGGFSGTVAAIHMLKQAKEPVEIMLIEREEKQRSGGIAYSAATNDERALTFSPANMMSVFADELNDFTHWLDETDRRNWPNALEPNSYNGNSYVPRVLYQLYLEERLNQAAAGNANAVLTRTPGEVVDVSDNPSEATVIFKDGTAYHANQVILATGLSDAKQLSAAKNIAESARYVADPYSVEGAERRKNIDSNATVALIGTGHAAFETAALLKQQGHVGKIVMISRHGHTPVVTTQRRNEVELNNPKLMKAATIPEFVKELRMDFWERTSVEGHHPTHVMQAYQKYVPDLIKKFSPESIRQLLQDHNSLLNSLTQGIPPQTARTIEQMKIEGQIEIRQANIHEMKPQADKVILRYTNSGESEDEALPVDQVISCIGHETIKSELWHNINARGQSLPHFTGNGIRTAEGGKLIDAVNNPSANVMAVGGMNNGETAVKGRLGLQANSVVSLRNAAADTAKLALEQIKKREPVLHNHVEPKTESVMDSVVIRDKSGRMRGQIHFDHALQPVEMQIFTGPAEGKLVEVHKRGPANHLVEVTCYVDGEAQKPEMRNIETLAFSWKSLLPGKNSPDRIHVQRTKPIILTTAHTGARYSPWQKSKDGKEMPIGDNFFAKHMPISPEEVILDAGMSYDAGSRLIHIHARNPVTGVQHADPAWYDEVAGGVRNRCPGAIISFPTSRKGEVGEEIDKHLDSLPAPESRAADIARRVEAEVNIRASGMRARPDTLTNFTVPEMKIFGTESIRDTRGLETLPRWSDMEVMQEYFKMVNKRASELGVAQEVEITTMGEFEVLDKLADQKEAFGFKGPLHMVLILGFSNGLPVDRETYEEALNRIDKLREKTGFEITVSCGAVIRPAEAAERPMKGTLPEGKHDYKEVMEWVAMDNRVDAFRVGLEDTPKMYGEQQTNAGLVEHAREFFESRNISIETNPSRIRRHFHLPSGQANIRPTTQVGQQIQAAAAIASTEMSRL